MHLNTDFVFGKIRRSEASWTGIRRGENSISLQIPMG
jgi:hypothetical protein